MELGQLKEAEIITRKAIELNPDFAEAYLNIGSILIELDQVKEAEIFTRKAIELNPDYDSAYSNLGIILKDLGKLNKAELFIKKATELNPNSLVAFSNLGNILRKLNKFQEAETALKKAIALNPNSIIGYANLGNMLKGLGRLSEAKKLLLKTIKINPEFVRPYYSLSKFENNISDKYWQDYLFSKKFLDKKTEEEKIDIYFARSNLLHKDKKFQESSKNLKLANNLKLKLHPSDMNLLINKTKALLNESNQQKRSGEKENSSHLNIFIVGMPRCGSTLVESIISLNEEVKDLGELNILEKAFIKSKNTNQKLSLNDLYIQKLDEHAKGYQITSNKWLYNYQYAGIIANQISNSKIIHCFRNPLDNILSITRANFDKGNFYSSSLTDCSRVYLDQKEIMKIYKKQFRNKIFSLDYDLLVSHPVKTIKALIEWLGWQWNEKYLLPHQNKRAVFTASDIQVRSPINSKSKGIWKNYKTMLEPAIEIFNQQKITPHT
jgi:tetratricopeptide (TPR) repeat protein